MPWYYQLAGYLVVAAVTYLLIREGDAPRWLALVAALLWPALMLWAFVRFVLRRPTWRP